MWRISAHTHSSTGENYLHPPPPPSVLSIFSSSISLCLTCLTLLLYISFYLFIPSVLMHPFRGLLQCTSFFIFILLLSPSFFFPLSSPLLLFSFRCAFIPFAGGMKKLRDLREYIVTILGICFTKDLRKNC